MKENLKKGFKKKKGKLISLLSSSLVIKHKKSGLEYTVKKVVINEEEPKIIAFRYYSKPDTKKKVFLIIPKREFKEYELV